MKTKILFIAFFLASSVLCLGANVNTGLIYSKSDAVTNSLEQIITFPEEAIEMHIDGIVVVDFTIMPGEEARINAINYSDIEFKKHVVKQLNKLNQEAESDLVGKTFIYKFKFVLK